MSDLWQVLEALPSTHRAKGKEYPATHTRSLRSEPARQLLEKADGHRTMEEQAESSIRSLNKGYRLSSTAHHRKSFVMVNVDMVVVVLSQAVIDPSGRPAGPEAEGAASPAQERKAVGSELRQVSFPLRCPMAFGDKYAVSANEANECDKIMLDCLEVMIRRPIVGHLEMTPYISRS